MRHSALLGACLALALGTASAAQAAVAYGGNLTGNDCSGGAFRNCHASIFGTQQGPGARYSPSIFKIGSDGETQRGGFTSIDGSEFSVMLNRQANTLSFTYTPGANDPEIRYFTIKQGSGYALFYDTAAPILGFTANLTTLFPSTPGFSHITFFGNRSTTATVPEPASFALFGAGLLGLAAARRRKALA